MDPTSTQALQQIPSIPPLSDETAIALTEEVLDLVEGFKVEDTSLALTLLLLTKQLLPPRTNPKTKIFLLSSLANFATTLNEFPIALEVLTEARSIAGNASMKKEQLTVATNLATTLRRSGQTKEALGVYEETIASIDDSSDAYLKASIFCNAATAYSDVGQHKRSLELNESAISLIKNDPNQQQLLLIACINAACSKMECFGPDVGDQSFSEALTLARRIGNDMQESVCIGHLGLIQMMQGRIDDATKLLEQAAFRLSV